MAGELGQQAVPIGLLLVQGGCLPQQLRLFLESTQVANADQAPRESQDIIQFHVLPSGNVSAAFEQVEFDFKMLTRSFALCRLF